MQEYIALSGGSLGFLMLSVFIAGVVRGFTGFAASAVVMALGTVILAPIELLPICLLLELTASAFLIRGGIADADYKLTIPLVGFAFAALPLGLYLSQTMDPELSKLVALALVAGLAAMQLARMTLPLGRGLGSSAFVGSLGGLIQGIAAVGGLVQALYILALNLPARTMRDTMILGVLFSGVIGLFWQVAMGVMTAQAVMLATLVLGPFAIGLWLGRRYFTPDNERFYRPISLYILITLAGAGMLRHLL